VTSGSGGRHIPANHANLGRSTYSPGIGERQAPSSTIPNAATISGRFAPNSHLVGHSGSPYVNPPSNNSSDSQPSLTYEQRREWQLYYENLKRNTACYECREPRHWGKECAKRHIRLKEKANRRHQQSFSQGFLATNQTTTDQNLADTANTIMDGAFFARDYALTTVFEVPSSTLATVDSPPRLSETWFADSGAMRHMTGHLHWFSTFQHIPEGQWPIRGINSQPVYARGIGRICIDCHLNGQWHLGYLEEVLYISNLTSNLFSLSRAASKGIDTVCTRNHYYLTIGNTVQMEGVLDNMLYRLLIQVKLPDTCLYTADIGTSNLHDTWQPLQT
jgi:hypothetical protein